MTTFGQLFSSFKDELNRGDSYDALIRELICEELREIEKDYTYLCMEETLEIGATRSWTPPANFKSVLGAAQTRECLAANHYTVDFYMEGKNVLFTPRHLSLIHI